MIEQNEIRVYKNTGSSRSLGFIGDFFKRNQGRDIYIDYDGKNGILIVSLVCDDTISNKKCFRIYRNPSKNLHTTMTPTLLLEDLESKILFSDNDESTSDQLVFYIEDAKDIIYSKIDKK